MTKLPFRLFGAIGLIGLAAGCSDTATQPTDDTIELAVAFEGLAADANRDGDAEGAAALSAGSIALRMGARPTPIEVMVNGEAVRHFALVAGVVRTIGDQRVMLRTLFAWTGDRRPASILEVGILGAEGTFNPVASTAFAGRARGVYRKLAARLRWVASSGSAAIALAGTGEACGRPLSDNPNIECVKARFDIRVDGIFHQRSDDRMMRPISDVPLRISTNAEGVNGVVVGPVGQ